MVWKASSFSREIRFVIMSAMVLEEPMCRIMGKTVSGSFCLFIHEGPWKLVRLPVPSMELWDKRAGLFLLQPCKTLLREYIYAVLSVPYLNMPSLLYYFSIALWGIRIIAPVSLIF